MVNVRGCAYRSGMGTRAVVLAFAAFVGGVFVAGAGCAVETQREPSVVEGAHGNFTFTLVDPIDVGEGRVDFVVQVEDVATGLPVVAGEVSARLTMPAMGHTSDPLADEIAPGRYELQDALIDMPGAWVLRVRVDDGVHVDEAELPLDVP